MHTCILAALLETESEVQFKIGADFCIPRGDRRTYTISCDVNSDSTSTQSIAFPTPDRAWLMEGDLLYQANVGEIPNIRESIDFFSSSPNRLLLFPDVVLPNVLQTTVYGGLVFNLITDNITLSPSMLPPGVTRDNFRDAVLDAVLGEWTCTVNNTFGVDSATSIITECGTYSTGYPIYLLHSCLHYQSVHVSTYMCMCACMSLAL